VGNNTHPAAPDVVENTTRPDFLPGVSPDGPYRPNVASTAA
jgi:hypothetical protein